MPPPRSEKVRTKGPSRLDLETLRTRLDYNPETGIFTRNPSAYKTGAKSKVGTVCAGGYLQIFVLDYPYRAHRLAWFYVYGLWPAEEIDHINGDPLDNRICNLREATHHQNTLNVKSWASCGYKGVSKKRSRWIARICYNGHQVVLGIFDFPEDAHAAYCAAAVKLHGEFARFR